MIYIYIYIYIFYEILHLLVIIQNNKRCTVQRIKIKPFCIFTVLSGSSRFFSIIAGVISIYP